MEQSGKQFGEDRISVAYQDRFFVVGVGSSESLAPHPVDTAELLGTLISDHICSAPSAEVAFDLRGLHEIYNDVHDFLYMVAGQLDPSHCSALVQPDDLDLATGLRFAPSITKTNQICQGRHSAGILMTCQISGILRTIRPLRIGTASVGCVIRHMCWRYWKRPPTRRIEYRSPGKKFNRHSVLQLKRRKCPGFLTYLGPTQQRSTPLMSGIA